MGRIFYLTGKSCTGKDSIYAKLLSDPDFLLEKIVLYTTRPMREGEEQGQEYFFVGEEELVQLQQLGKVIEQREYDTIHGVWKYFTVNDGQFDITHHHYLAIGTLESFINVRKYFSGLFPDLDVVLPIYVEVEDGDRLERALKRERKQDLPKYQEMCRRFLADSEDFSEENIKKAGINKRFVNDVREKCIGEIREFIAAEINKEQMEADKE